MRLIHLCGAACIACLLPSGASAVVIFDQSIDLTVGAAVSDHAFKPGHDPYQAPMQIADDFKLRSGASTITDVHWWGVYGNTNTFGPLTDSFRIQIFADISGTPENQPLTEDLFGAVKRVDTGVDLIDGFGDSYDVFAYSVDVTPLTLAPNTIYWLSILNSTNIDEDTIWLWSLDGSVVGNAAVFRADPFPWTLFGGSFGFQLTNDAVAVPEPATWALFAAGLASLGWMGRRHKAG